MKESKEHFGDWMKAVDKEIEKITGSFLDSNDLPDRPFYEEFEDGMNPHDAAEEALDYAGFYDYRGW